MSEFAVASSGAFVFFPLQGNERSADDYALDGVEDLLSHHNVDGSMIHIANIDK